MSGLGDRLRKEREMRGVTLDEIAAATRIHRKFLKALEENDFDALPAPVFVTGFLRSYAQHLGMDADSLVAEYEAIKKPAKAYEPLVPEEQKLPFISKEEINRNFPLIAGGIGIVLVLVLLVVFISRSSTPNEAPVAQPAEEDLLAQPAAEPPPAEAPAEGTPAEAEPAATQEEPAKAETLHARAEEAPARTAEKPKPEAAKPVEKPKAEPARVAEKPKAESADAEPAPRANYRYSLGLSAIDQDVWVYVLIDDSDVRDMYVRAGQTVYLRGNESFVLTTGNSYYLKLKVNGAPVEIPSAGANKVIRNWAVPLPG